MHWITMDNPLSLPLLASFVANLVLLVCIIFLIGRISRKR